MTELRWPTWIGVIVKDLEAQRLFYRETLGFREIESGDGWVQFDIYFIPVRELDPTTGRPELGYGPRDPAQLGPLSPQAPSEEQSRWIEEHG